MGKECLHQLHCEEFVLSTAEILFKHLEALEWHFQNEELPFLGTDGPIWKLIAALKENTPYSRADEM